MTTPNSDVPRNGGEQHNMKIGGFHLCPKGHGMVQNGKACPQCELEATLTPEQKASMLKAWAQEQVKKSNEKLRELSQVFTEGNAKQPGWAGEIYLPCGEQSAEVPNKGVDAGTPGDQKTMSTNASEVEKEIETAFRRRNESQMNPEHDKAERFPNAECYGWRDLTAEDINEWELNLVHMIFGPKPAYLSDTEWRDNMRGCAKSIRAHGNRETAALREENAELVKELRNAVELAQAIHRNIDEEQWASPKDELWVPTIHAHASVIIEDCNLALAKHASRQGGNGR